MAAVNTEEWENSPRNWSRDDCICLNSTQAVTRLEDAENKYFLEEDDDDINVRITDVDEGTNRVLWSRWDADAARTFSIETV